MASPGRSRCPARAARRRTSSLSHSCRRRFTNSCARIGLLSWLTSGIRKYGQVPDGTSGSQAPGGAWPGPPNEDLVVATPDRVSFSYQTANVGSRFVALLIDSVMQLLLLAGVGAVFLLVNGITNSSTAAGLILLVGSFVVFGGYFMVSEAVWSGQTLGKRALRLRAVDARGGPLTVGQAIIRNLVRSVDFLPSYY